jgi:hypothetical protein
MPTGSRTDPWPLPSGAPPIGTARLAELDRLLPSHNLFEVVLVDSETHREQVLKPRTAP